MAKNSNNKVIKILVVLFILFFAIVAGYEYFRYGSVFNNAEHYRNIYAQAIEQKNNEEYSQAFSSLEAISPRYEAYDAVLYQQAQCAMKTGDEASVQKKLKSLISKYPQSYLYVSTKYELAKSYLRAGEKSLSADTFQNIINSHKNTNFETGSYYYLAEINREKSLPVAVKYWKKYIEQSQDGRFSLDCVNNIINSKADLTPNDNYNIGLVYLYNGKNDLAVNYLKNAPEDMSWFYLAKAFIAKKNYQPAKDYLYQGLQTNSSKYSTDDIANLLYSFVSLSSAPKQLWTELVEILKNKQNLEDIALYNLAGYLPSDEAVSLYKRIAENHLKGDYASEALEKMFWYYYRQGDYKTAKDIASKHISNFSNTKSAPEMNFWLGKIYEAEDNKNSAIKMYNRILSKYPDDYYAMRAYSRISFLTKGIDYAWSFAPKGILKQTHFELPLPYSYSDIKTKFGATLAELLLVEDFATIEYFDDFKEPFIESWIAYKKGLRSTATTIARNAMEEFSEKPERADKKWKFVYPCYFVPEINKYAQKNKLSPYLLISLIREESYFNPLSLSPSNAVGLTQILPSTAKEVASRKGYGRINEFLLFNPETNIKYGAAYFAQIKKQMKNNSLYAVASYNGGAGAVSSWIKKNNVSDMDEFVENIPYPETKNYVKKVFRSYWNYVRIYAE